jgi:hypothetical protein
MNRKIAIIIVSVILLIAIIAIIWSIGLKKPAYQEVFDETYAACIEERSETYNLIMAQKTADEKYCKKIKSEAQKFCIATLNKDPSVCETLPEEAKKDCVAAITKNSALCTENNYECLAETTKNPEYCNQLNDTQEVIQECIAFTTLNEEFFLKDTDKQECEDIAYSSAALSIGDIKTCEKIKNPELKEDCINVLK